MASAPVGSGVRGASMRLGFVGTGTMGAPMAGCLIDAGHDLAIYDVRLDAMAALCARGARPAEDPAAVARSSEVVFSSLPGTRRRHARCAGERAAVDDDGHGWR